MDKFPAATEPDRCRSVTAGAGLAKIARISKHGMLRSGQARNSRQRDRSPSAKRYEFAIHVVPSVTGPHSTALSHAVPLWLFAFSVKSVERR